MIPNQPTEIEFTIQTLDGDTFTVSIPLSEAVKVWPGAFTSINSLYAQYGLDVLKDAICNHNGTDPDRQQLICQEELTISTPLPPLATSVITLIVMSPFQIEFIPTMPVSEQVDLHAIFTGTGRRVSDVYSLVANLDHLIPKWTPFETWTPFESPAVAYLHIWYEPSNTTTLQVMGKRRDYFKIAKADLIDTDRHLRNTQWISKKSGQYYTQLTHVWLKYNTDNIKII